jgi:cytosol alanyl aminopeptidase
MFESFVGPKQFQAGVHAYLERHAHGNATATDFLKDVGEVSGRKDTFAPAFATFLDQPGLPLVTATLTCDGAPKVALSQVRYLPQGSNGVPAQSWKIPVCVSYPGGKSCTLMNEATEVLPLSDTKTCPTWINANANADGYYRVAYKGELSSRVLQATGPAQTVHERVGTLGDVLALVRSGAMQEGDALERVPTLVREGNRHLVGMTTGLVQGLSEPTDLGALKPNYERFVAKTFGPRARELGWKPKGGEDDGTRLLRPNVLALVTRDEKSALAKEARVLTEAWIANRKAIEPDLVAVVLETSGRGGDRALWDKLRAAAKTTADRKERGQLLAGMASFRDVTLIRENFAIAISDEFDARESLKLVFGASQNPETRQLAYDFVKANFERIASRIPNEWGARLASVGEGFCDTAHRTDLAAFFSDKVARFNGGPRELAQTLESIDLCTAQNPSRQASIAAFLKKY